MSEANIRSSNIPSTIQCQNSAFFYALSELMLPEASAISYGVPVQTSSSQALAFMLYFYGIDNFKGDYYYFKPKMSVTVDVNTQQIINHEIWRKSELSDERLFGYRFSPLAREQNSDAIALLVRELYILTEDMLTLFGKTDLTEVEKQKVIRYDRLFRFLVPRQLFSYYDRLNPDFFAWLAQQTGTIHLRPLREVPEPNPDISQPLLIPTHQEWKASLHPKFKDGPTWKINTSELAKALHDVSLTPTPNSPIADIQPSAEAEAWLLPENVPGWPTEEWKIALKALCEPGWEVDYFFGSEQVLLTTSLFIGQEVDEAGEALWVRYTRDEDIHSIHFPQFPQRIKDITLEGLAASVVKTAQQVIHSFTIETIAVLFALADITSLNGRNFRGISLADQK